MRTLVTGGAGFIGSHLCEALLARGDQVVALDNLATGRQENLSDCLQQERFQFIEGSAGDPRLMEDLAEKCDLIYHLASAVGVELIVAEPVKTIQTNIQTCQTVLAAAAKFSRPVLLTSSSEVYGKGKSVPFREDDDTVLGPTTMSRWSYAASKTVAEHLALAYHRQHGLPAVIIRLFNTVGPRQTGRYGMVLPRFVQAALRGEDLLVYGSGEQTRCFAYVGDVVAALLRLLGEKQAFGQVFNLGSDDEVTINKLAAKVIAATSSKSRIRAVSYEEAYGPGFEDLLRRRPSLKKITQLIGYHPAVSLDEILARLIDYHRTSNQS